MVCTGSLSDSIFFCFLTWFHKLIIASHLRRQIPHSFLEHQENARTPQGGTAPGRTAEPTAAGRMCYRGSRRPSPNTANRRAYLQEIPGLWHQRGWGDTKAFVGNAKPVLDAAAGVWSSEGEG